MTLPELDYQVTQHTQSNAHQRKLGNFSRRDLYSTYGGRERCHVLLALGNVDELILTLMHELAQERQALAATQGLSLIHI